MGNVIGPEDGDVWEWQFKGNIFVLEIGSKIDLLPKTSLTQSLLYQLQCLI